MSGKVVSGPTAQQQAQQTVAGGFVVGRADQSQPKSVKAIVPLEPYLVLFTDGAGKEHTQVALFNRPAGTVVLVHEQLEGTAIVSDAAPWLTQAFKKSLSRANGQDEPTAA